MPEMQLQKGEQVLVEARTGDQLVPGDVVVVGQNLFTVESIEPREIEVTSVNIQTGVFTVEKKPGVVVHHTDTDKPGFLEDGMIATIMVSVPVPATVPEDWA